MALIHSDPKEGHTSEVSVASCLVGNFANFKGGDCENELIAVPVPCNVRPAFPDQEHPKWFHREQP